MNCDEFHKHLEDYKSLPLVFRHTVEGNNAESPIVVTEELKLKGMQFEYPVIIRHVVFKKFVDFSEWHCKAGLRLEDTTVEGCYSTLKSAANISSPLRPTSLSCGMES